MRKNFSLGQFNKNIEFCTDNAHSYTAPISYKAIIRPITVGSIYNYEQIEATHQIHRNFFCFTIRYDAQIKDFSHIKLAERLFRIIRIINSNEANRFMQIYAEEENV
jgi:hypothetical protein